MPPKKLSGTEMTSAQGQDTTKKMRAFCTQPVQFPTKRGGTTARARAQNTTTGV